MNQAGMTQIRVAAFDELPDVGGLKVEVNGVEVAVFRVGDGVFALADRCSHAEASLSEGEVFDTEVECPRHGATFDLSSGDALTLPATRPVATYATSVRDGEVFLEVKQ